MDGNTFNSSDLLQAFTTAAANSAAGKTSIHLDVGNYLHFLDEMDAPEAVKLELLSIVADILARCADMGFGLDPVQQACGKDLKNATESVQEATKMLGSDISERSAE